MALHGWFGSARGWGSLPDYLDGSAFTYVFPDLRGYGGRWDVTGEFTLAEAAADALALADELGWERLAMVGHSMPGQAVQHAVLQAPGR
jgi:pimeloyl-ACP methyl ester carboxylesterase